MPTLPELRIATLLAPYLPEVTLGLPGQLSHYLDLLLKWNARINLTAIREPEQIVQRHFGESLFCARHLSPQTTSLLDLGSGAGFPGLPIALLRPQISVTLAESQNKKAAFLHEAVRTLQPANIKIWAGRAETLPEEIRFDIVTLRAVDNMSSALAAAAMRATREIFVLASEKPQLPLDFILHPPMAVPGTHASFLFRATRS